MKDVAVTTTDAVPEHGYARASPEPHSAVDQERSRGTRKWNTLSLIAAGGVALAFIALFIGGGAALWSYLLGASLILAVVGLVQAIQRDERGKGIAIAAIVLPILFLALVIAALNAAW